MTDLGRLREIREGLGMSQELVSSLLGICRQTLSDIERGDREIGIGLLERLVRIYGYDLRVYIEDMVGDIRRRIDLL